MSIFSIRDTLKIDVPEIEILDAGAMAEGEDRYGILRDMELARVTGFEPGETQYEALKQKDTPRTRYLPYFLGDGMPRNYYATRYPGCSSLYEPDSSVINLFTSIGTEEALSGNFSVIDEDRVATRRLDDIDECGTPDFVKLDIQGAELDVLRHGSRTVSSALVIESEVEFLPVYKDQPLFGDVQVYLRDLGFVLHKLIDVGGRGIRPMHRGQNPFAAISQLLWADAVFVRDFTRLDRFDDSGLIKAAVILHHVYYSYDLVAYLLREHDRREGGMLEQAYLQALGKEPNLPFLFMNMKEHV